MKINPETAFDVARKITTSTVSYSTKFAVTGALTAITPTKRPYEKYAVAIAGWAVGTLIAKQAAELADQEFTKFQMMFFDEVPVTIDPVDTTTE